MLPLPGPAAAAIGAINISAATTSGRGFFFNLPTAVQRAAREIFCVEKKRD